MKILSSFWLLTLPGVILCFPLNISAQCTYTDLHDTVLVYPPDIVGETNSGVNTYYFDLDADGTDDLVFGLAYHEYWGSPSANEIPEWILGVGGIGDGSEVASSGPYSCSELSQFFDREVIDSTAPYSSQATIHYISYYMVYDVCCAYFEGQSLGFRLIRDGLDYYGWIRIVAYCQANGHVSFIQLIDCAVNTRPGEAILAGTTESNIGISGPCSKNLEIWHDNRKLEFVLTRTFNGTLMISNISGSIFLIKNFFGQTIEQDISFLPAGFYIIRINVGYNQFVKKFIKI